MLYDAINNVTTVLCAISVILLAIAAIKSVCSWAYAKLVYLLEARAAAQVKALEDRMQAQLRQMEHRFEQLDGRCNQAHDEIKQEMAKLLPWHD